VYVCPCNACHIRRYEDLAYAVAKGGDPIDGPTLLTDEPTGDAMRWDPTSDECPVPVCGRTLHAAVRTDLTTGHLTHIEEAS
jgi:hypothetical protein